MLKHSTQKIMMLAMVAMVIYMGTGLLWSLDVGKLRLVVNDSKGKTIDEANVTLRDTMDPVAKLITAKTKKNGVLVLNGLKNHVWEITVEKEGYTPSRKNVKIPAGLLLDEEMVLATTEETMQKMAANDPRGQAINEFNLAATKLNEKDYDGALEHLTKSISIDPNIFQAHFYSAVAYFEKADYNESIKSLNKAQELKPEDAQVYRLMAACYEKLGNKAEMEKYTKLAQEKGGKTPIDIYNEGVTSFNAGDTDKAIEAFENAVKLDPKFADAYYRLGLCYINKEMNAKAIENLKKYLELKPEGDDASTAKSILESLQ